MSTRKTKLLQLSKFLDLETEQLKKDAFAAEDRWFRKTEQKKRLNSVMRRCSQCDGMNIRCCTEAVMGGPNIDSFVVIVGQSPSVRCMVSGINFTKGSGYYIDAALRLSHLKRMDVFLTDVIHCHPPRDAANTEEQTHNCLPFLRKELEIVQPRLIVALGTPAHDAIKSIMAERIQILPRKKKESRAEFQKRVTIAIKAHIRNRCSVVKMKHPAWYMHKGDPEGVKDWIIKLSMTLDKYKGE